MVLKKAIDYGFNGYRVPVIPKGPRSVRKRGSLKKAFEESDICAFELLAAVAGKLLQESESSASSNADEGKDLSKIHGTGIKQEVLDEGKALSSECIDQASCIESGFIAELSQKCDLKSTFREFPHWHDNTLGNTSKVSSPNFNKKAGHDGKSRIAENQSADINNSGKVEGESPESGETWGGVVDNELKRWVQGDGKLIHKEETLAANTNRSRVPMETCVNTHPLVNSDSSVKMTSYRDSDPNIYFSRNSNNVKVVSRDDDDKFVGYNRSRSKIRAFRSQNRIGHRRIRKLLTSKYWKAAPKLKDYEFSNTDGGMKHVSRCRKAPYSRERIQQEGPFKKRKLFDYCRTPAYDREGSSDSISNSPERGIKTEKNGSPMKSHRARGVYRSSVVDHQSSFQSNGSHVKFSIKSFKVPELYVEVPETATVGSLKRTVMEAVNAILRGGLRVGVVLHGQKVKEDNRTLLQAGISHDDNLDTLGFTLEPNSGISSPSISPRKPPVLLPCETLQQLSRLASSAVFDSGFSNASSDPPPIANVENHTEVNKELTPSSVELITAAIATDSKALVPVPPMNLEALAVVPVSQKTKRCELAHRRTRRPFSVTEVEALVEAVEKLGTGRWRDVKLSAFENADHRTYVDLKDKWKTLVHTASISPQQRRGEPVPQELLDRVLAAHGYWTQHQSRQHGKHQADPLNSTSDA